MAVPGCKIGSWQFYEVLWTDLQFRVTLASKIDPDRQNDRQLMIWYFADVYSEVFPPPEYHADAIAARYQENHAPAGADRFPNTSTGLSVFQHRRHSESDDNFDQVSSFFLMVMFIYCSFIEKWVGGVKGNRPRQECVTKIKHGIRLSGPKHLRWS